MTSEGEHLQADSADVRIPWEWRDPWAWIAMLLIGLSLFLLFKGDEILGRGPWVGTCCMLGVAAEMRRQEQYLRRIGIQLERAAKFRRWAVTYLGLGIFFLLACLGFVLL